MLQFKFPMLFKRMYVRNYIKILWFAFSYGFEKNVWGNDMKMLPLNFLMLFKRMYGINDMKILWFANSYAFQKDVWDKLYENTLICNFLCFSKGCIG